MRAFFITAFLIFYCTSSFAANVEKRVLKHRPEISTQNKAHLGTIISLCWPHDARAVDAVVVSGKDGEFSATIEGSVTHSRESARARIVAGAGIRRGLKEYAHETCDLDTQVRMNAVSGLVDGLWDGALNDLGRVVVLRKNSALVIDHIRGVVDVDVDVVLDELEADE